MSVFYGWKISALSLAGNFMLQGSGLYCMNAFMEPLCELHGWTRMGLNMSLGIAALMGQIAMPVSADVATKVSLRTLMGLGALVGGLAICGMAFTSSIHVFTLYMILVWIASQFCGGVVANALMSNWFSHFRGIAFGVANSGTSLSGMILPFICLAIINHFNVQTAFLSLGIATCALAPLSWWIVRRKPQMLHLHPDGRKHEPRPAKGVPVNTSVKILVRRPAVWSIGIAFGLTLMCASGILSQLKPRFADLGMESYFAMTLASIAAGAGTLAKYFWGWVCDKWSPIFAARAITLCCLCSMMALFLPPSKASLAIFGIFFASGSGGLWVVLPAVTAYYFGNQNFLAVYKFIAVFILLRCAGFPVMGMSYEYCGSYIGADIFFIVSLAAAFVLTMFLHPERAVENIARKHHHHH